MRIVDVNEFYSPTGGGVRTYVDRKMELLADLGHELIVVAPGRKDAVDERPGGGRIIYITAPPLPFDKNYGLFWDRDPVTSLLHELKPDVVEASSPWRPAWIVGDWQGDAAKIFFMHNDNVTAYPGRWFERVASAQAVERGFAWYSRYMQNFLAKYDAVVTNGPALQKLLDQRGVRVDASMPLGIERGHFSPTLRDEKLRAALLAQCGLPADGHLILGLGRHHSQKRWDMVIEAIERVQASRPVGFVLIGDGVHRKQIAKRVAQNPHVKLFRPVYDRARLARIMASCDALIHGNEGETFGLVAAEAAASGLPLIVPDEGGCFEIADPRCAETFTPRDAKSCARAIERLLAREPSLLRRAALVTAGKVRTDREHALELVAYYEAVLARKRGLTNQAARSI